MKKWLIWCLTVLAMVCLIPGIVLKAAAETVPVHCLRCGSRETREILGYRKYDSTYHRVYVTECQNCHNDGNVTLLQVHTGGTQGPTCTEGKICEDCGAEYDIPGHVWGAWTPNGNGTHTRRCTNPNCDAKEENVPCGGDSRATCIRPGTCTTCGGSYYGGHDWGAWRPNDDGTHTRRCTRSNCDGAETENCSGGTATCSAKAVCKVCGGKYGIRDLSNHALVHHAAKAPTCTEIGWDAFDTCSRCNYTTRKELPAQHKFVYHKAKTATCKEIGWGAYKTCKNCDYTDYQEIPTLNHDLKQHVIKAPTCTETGLAYVTCWRCDYFTYQAIPALKHDLEQHAAKAPTCTEKGWNAYETCSRCDYTTYVELPAQHDLEQYAAKAPTCTEIGWDAYDRCIRCGYTTRKELPAQHDLEQHAAKAPTCTEKGWDAYETCSRCDYTTYAELPALNHDLVRHDAKAATCTEIGWNAYDTCKNCDYTTYAEVPALNHDLKQHEAQAPTCTEIGWDAYETCSRCDYTTYTELPALNHDLVQHEAQAPTCTEIGWDAYKTCSRCDYTTYAELPALNHDYQAVTVAPTCEADGYTVFTCSRCNDSYTADPTDKLGHQFGAWSPNGTGSQSADCLRQGCTHTGSTDCRKFTFRTAEGETLTFCPVCGQAENAAQLEMIDAATAWPLIGSLSAEDVTARTNGEYLSVAFETAGSLTQPTGRVRLALPAGLLEGKTLVRIAPDGTQTEMPFETKRGKIILTLDFVNSELPVMLFRLVPQTAAL